MTSVAPSSKPVIVYVDDEPRNVALIDLALPSDEWSLYCFDSAVEAIKRVKDLDPAVIVSDQRMPQMSGLEFLEICSQLAPDAVRIVVTGQTREDLVVELVQRAKIFDYVTKPWQTNDLIARIRKGVEFHRIVHERREAFAALQQKNLELERKSAELYRSYRELHERELRELKLRQEMEGWVPWPVAQALRDGGLRFPFRKDIVCLVFDIIGSSPLANMVIEGRAARTRIMRLFRELVIGNGGLTESQGGDACYAHFGALDAHKNPVHAALTAAREFRVKLRSFCNAHAINVECGIALHYATDALIDQETIKLMSDDDHTRVEKSLVTQSSQIDVVHRIEKLLHKLPGSSILMTRAFAARVKESGFAPVELGQVRVRGQDEIIDLLLIPSDLLTHDHIALFKRELAALATSAHGELDQAA